MRDIRDLVLTQLLEHRKDVFVEIFMQCADRHDAEPYTSQANILRQERKTEWELDEQETEPNYRTLSHDLYIGWRAWHASEWNPSHGLFFQPSAMGLDDQSSSIAQDASAGDEPSRVQEYDHSWVRLHEIAPKNWLCSTGSGLNGINNDKQTAICSVLVEHNSYVVIVRN